MSEPKLHYRACNLCEAICGIEIQVENGEIRSIRGNPEDPLSRGHICPKAVALKDIHNDPDRLRHPVRRSGDAWQRIGWDEAFDEVADRLGAIRAEHGRDAVAIYLGNPNVHNYGFLLFGPPFLRTLRTRHRYSATSVDQLPHQLVAWQLFGHQFLLPVPDIDRTRYFLVLGANPVVSNGSLMTAPDVKRRLQAIRERGGKVVVVDPRRTETAGLADRHLFVRPGTDALLLAALVHTVFEEGLADPGPPAAFTDGIARVRELVRDFPPEAVAAVTGMAADEIRSLARDFCAADSAVCYGRMGLSTQEFGSLCQWLIQVLNLITGNLDRPGGVMFTRPAVDVVGRKLSRRGSYGRWTSRVRGLPEVGGELPVASLAEDILAGDDGGIRALITSAGNPVLSTPNGRQLDRALFELDFMVSIDFYVNETTRHAHIILPPTATLEHDHYDISFLGLAIRNVARFSEPLFEPGEDTRHDWQILIELEKRLGPRDWRSRLGRRLRERVGPAGLIDLALRTGPYGSLFQPWKKGLSLRRLRKHVHGLDLGPLEPCLPGRLKTENHRIDLAPELLVGDLGRLKDRLQRDGNGDGSLLLIGRRDLRSCNSWMHNYERLMGGNHRCTLFIHPDDAGRLGIEDGTPVVVRSRVGSVETAAQLTDTMMPGVVSLPHGWGHHRSGVRLQVAASQPGVSANDLTDHESLDVLSGNAALNGVPVEVLPAPG